MESAEGLKQPQAIPHRISPSASFEGLPPYMSSEPDHSFPPSSASSGGATTPTHTTVMDDSKSQFQLPGFQNKNIETPPCPGHTFVIRERGSARRLITLINGKLRLESYKWEQGGWHWKCEEKQGWLGFRNPVSGWYIGHDTKGNYCASVPLHEPQEYFCARRCPQGGYVLLTRQGDELHKMVIAEDGCSLVHTTGEGTAWDFEQADDCKTPKLE